MSFKHFISDPEKLVLDALEALTYGNPTLQLLRSEKAIVTSSRSPSRIALLSGGGAGHEPAHAAYVGANMLTAAVSGSIFASPSVSQIYNTITQIASPAGVLLIVKNYTGDIFNFSLAASKARAAGIPTEVVVVADDVAVGREKGGRVGRRGLAGTVLVQKIAGAFAASDRKPALKQVKALAADVVDGLVTAGVSLDRVHVPGRRKNRADFLGDDEVELGMGIHNEPGIRSISPVPELGEIVAEMLKMCLDDADKDRAFVDFGREHAGVVLMVNNLGGMSVLELNGVAAEVHRQLASKYGIKPARLYIGTYMTSLNGPGFSITLLRATQQMLDYLDAPVQCVGWSPNSILIESQNPDTVSEKVIEKSADESDSAPLATSSGLWRQPDVVQIFHKALAKACAKVIAAEPTITEYDTIVGDGDCGTTLRRGAEAISSYLSDPSTPSDPLTNLLQIASIIEANMDGTSGAITAIFVNSLAGALRDLSTTKISSTASSSSEPYQLPLAAEAWSLAASSALKSLQSVTPARPGDRTLMDALTPFVEILETTKNVKEAAKAARKGADGTMGMRARLGRSVYVDEGAYARVPDPGAIGIAEFLEGLAEGL